MGHRMYSRRGNGQFRRATLENTFGLKAPSCPSCGILNPHGVNEPEPENCHDCGAEMRPVVRRTQAEQDALDHAAAMERAHEMAWKYAGKRPDGHQ